MPLLGTIVTEQGHFAFLRIRKERRRMELRIEGLSKKFKDKAAVDQVSLTLTAGVWGLLGANGAGVRRSGDKNIMNEGNPTRTIRN